MIPRLIEKSVIEALGKHKKAIIIFGARQVGKTTVMKKVKTWAEGAGQKALYLNCDISEERSTIDTTSRTKLEHLLDDIDVLLIDEAQMMENPGLTVKVIHDHFPAIRLMVTGSSAFELRNAMSDALTGRALEYSLYPLALSEIVGTQEELDNRALWEAAAQELVAGIMSYGLYPGVYTAATAGDKARYLQQIVESYLFKDILSFQKIRNPRALQDLTRTLAYMIDTEVSELELATRLKIDRKTVVKYLDILEQSYIIVRLTPFSKNPAREIGKNRKVYFTDLGIRNALIGDFNPIEVRGDRDALWKNFLIMERLKAYAHTGIRVAQHFWRTYAGSAVDYIERRNEEHQVRAFMMPFAVSDQSAGNRTFVAEYQVTPQIVAPGTIRDFVCIT